MARQSVLSRVKVNHSLSRNGFDLSCRKAFNFSCGMLLPVEWKQFTAGSKVKLNRKVFIRTADVNTAAFTPIDFFMDYYKVPLRYLWSPWNDFKTGISDMNSTALQAVTGSLQQSPFVVTRCPMLDLNAFEKAVTDNVENNNTADLQGNIYKDSLGYLYVNGYLRLRDLLRYGGNGLIHGTVSSNAWLVNVFPALAYQKIYFDHYRNTAYESNNPYAYNLDWMGDLYMPDLTNEDHFSIARQWFNLRYVNYRNDYYQNLYPSLNYVVSDPVGNSFLVPDSVIGIRGTRPTIASFGSVTIGGSNNNSNLTTVQNIRAAFALDKLSRAAAYAPKHVKEQFKARFGVTLSDAVSSESYRLGSFKCDIKLMEVTSSADTEQAGLGAIGAKGIGFGDSENTIETYCDEDCIIMAVAYAIPRSSYDAYGCDEWLTKTNFADFFQPEYENLGLEPVYGWQMRRWLDNAPAHDAQNNLLIGYRPRNQVYKLSADLNHGEFRGQNPQYNYRSSDGLYHPTAGASTLDAFVVHTNIGRSSFQPSYSFFKVMPDDVNSLFVSQYGTDGAPVHDQFFGYLECIQPAIMNMSVHGQPSF